MEGFQSGWMRPQGLPLRGKTAYLADKWFHQQKFSANVGVASYKHTATGSKCIGKRPYASATGDSDRPRGDAVMFALYLDP